MEIKSSYTNRSGQKLDLNYREDDPLRDVKGKILLTVHAICFCRGKLVIVYAHDKGYWAPPGGGIELGESYEQAVVREVREETNMKVLNQKFIGYQDIYESDRIFRQTRSVCIVEPYGPFIKDPDGDITEIKLIDASDYKKYFDWGEVGDRIMSRACDLVRVMQI
ncbi:MAG: NUDIX hydrolase [Candidatus Paceibacterota bacterium]